PLAQLGPGDFFGEMSILEDQPRFASAMARTNVRLLRIDRAAFGEVLAQNVEIAIRIMRKLTARLRRAEQRASDAHGALDVSRSLSRRHAKLLVEGQRCLLREDVGTTNGTFVNGERVRTGEPVALKPGDKIRFGAVEVEFAA